MKSYTVLKKDEGQTLIKYLRRILKNSYDPFIYRMLRKKNILLSGKKASGKELIREGDIVSIVDDNGKEIAVGRTSMDSVTATGSTGEHDQKPIVHYDYLYLNQ